MCVAVPVRVLDLAGGAMPMGHVDHDGTARVCCFAYVPEVRVGDFVVVQNGFALDILDQASAEASLAAFAEVNLTVGQPRS